MTRHAKNNTASSVYSYHERQQDQQISGYGTQRKRLSKDSIKQFNACNLTLQPCRNPVITPEGYLYDKEAILEYILKEKNKIIKNKKRYEKQLKEHAKSESSSNLQSQKPSSSSVSNMSDGNDKQLPSFWIPNLTPTTNNNKMIKKPDSVVRCPMSGKPLKVNQLIDVKFTKHSEECAKSSKSGQDAIYKCAISGDILTNSTRCVVLKTSGSVITEECYERIKKDMVDPVNDKPVKESDVIRLQRGGTGYSSANDNALEAKLYRPVMSA